MSKNMNCDCPAHSKTFWGGTKQNRGARDISSLGRACLLHTVPLSFCHLLPRGTWPISKRRFCRSRCESSGWRLLWPPTASTGKQLGGGTELCQEKPDLPFVSLYLTTRDRKNHRRFCQTPNKDIKCTHTFFIIAAFHGTKRRDLITHRLC